MGEKKKALACKPKNGVEEDGSAAKRRPYQMERSSFAADKNLTRLQQSTLTLLPLDSAASSQYLLLLLPSTLVRSKSLEFCCP